MPNTVEDKLKHSNAVRSIEPETRSVRQTTRRPAGSRQNGRVKSVSRTRSTIFDNESALFRKRKGTDSADRAQALGRMLRHLDQL